MNKDKARIRLSVFILIIISIFTAADAADYSEQISQTKVPILLYHRFGATASDSMTITTDVFESHIRYIRDNGYTVIPLRHLIDYYQGKNISLPKNPVVIVADDGHISVYKEMLPIVKKYRIPVTLFIYPSAISNASYAMTWDQLRELKATGLFDFQSHTYWHPNFNIERRRLSPEGYDKFVDMQMNKSREKIKKELDVNADMLAWPFGIYDEALLQKARSAGYSAAFTIERQHASKSFNIMALPRYLMTKRDMGKTFEAIINGGLLRKNKKQGE